MTNLRSAIDMMRDFDRYFVGLDQHLNKLNRVSTTQNFPPYNIRRTDENQYVVEFALAGYNEGDVEIEVEDGVLIVRGQGSKEDTENYLYRGISKRAFTQQIALEDNIQVHGAEMQNGLLCIALERIVPEEKKPRKIEIKYTSSTPQLLTE